MKRRDVGVAIQFVLSVLLLTGATLSVRAQTTPIKHLVVIFQENVSFDHYFATYPNALNPSGEPVFKAQPGTPSVNGLTDTLIAFNPNSSPPFRLDRSQAATCDQDHVYKDEQAAMNAGLMDKFVENVGTKGTAKSGNTVCHPNDVMGYFDGNTVTAVWNYAQHFAMSDNSFGTTFGPSTPGALNLIAGQTNGAIGSCALEPASALCVATADSLSTKFGVDVVQGSVVSDPQPMFDDCSSRETVAMSGPNVGDLLNAKGITWGFFQGGFKPTAVVSGKAVCGASHIGSNGNAQVDYIPHHQPFQYFASTANPHHLPPSSAAKVGQSDQANHQYDLSDFWNAVNVGNLPTVVFLKAPGYQDGHAGYSDPLAEQQFLVTAINNLQQLPQWNDMAIVIAYDDSDGWYDHVMPPIVSQSNTTQDALTGPNACGATPAGALPGRCGYGPRLPLLVISPFAKQNYVDHETTDQSSILRFIEDNWGLGRLGNQSFDAKAGSLMGMFDFSHHDDHEEETSLLLLDPVSGQPVHGKGHED
jgi:phospholipase C